MYSDRENAGCLLQVVSPIGFLVLYSVAIVPWWVSQAASCSIIRRPWDAIEYTWSVWTSSDCTWSSSHAQAVLPTLFIVIPFLLLLMIKLWADWQNGPPEWAVGMTSFGLSAVVAGGFWVLGWLILVDVIVGGVFGISMTSSATLLQYIIAIMYFFGALIAGFWLWVKVYRFIQAAFTANTSSASAPILYVGSTLGAVMGVSIGVAVCLVAALAIFIVVGFDVMVGLGAIAVVGIGVAAAKR